MLDRMAFHGIRKRLRAGETLIGTVIGLPLADVAEIVAGAGFDWLWIDTEHTPVSDETCQRMLQAIGPLCAGLVRVAENRDFLIKRALETGCEGVIVPQVRSAAEAADAVSSCRYPPAGRRSVGAARAHAWGRRFDEVLAAANDEVCVVVQAEHVDAVRSIESIVRVEGLGAVLVGPYDLSASLGIPGRVDDPRVQDAIRTVRDACRSAGVPAGIFAGDPQRARRFRAEGFQLIGMGTDVGYLCGAVDAALAAFRAPG
jgi:2-dehydro-3-deoxyglucarate aldolase/4-hydroxy-2-oxoheptanedioate aldolase